MIKDFRQPGALTLPKDAVLVVGSGPAGLTVALALGRQGREVLLLESGDDSSRANAVEESAHLNEGVSEDQPYNGLVRGRARMLGGTSELWPGQCMRLHEIDLRPRPWVPDSGWPISLTDLEDHYAAAERMLDVSGRGYAASRWSEHPHLPPLAWDPDRLVHTFTEFSRYPHLSTRYRDDLARHPHVSVLVHATVGRVFVERGRVAGVEVLDTGGRRERVDASVVVLAAGTIENTRLLQLSDPAGRGLGSGRAHTGCYLQDHPIIRLAEVQASDHRVLQDRYVGLWRQRRCVFPKVRLSPAAQVRHQLLDAAAIFEHEHDDGALDAARRLAQALSRGRLPVRGDVLRAPLAGPAILRALVRRHMLGKASSFAARPRHVWLQAWVEQAPKRERRIALADSVDALGLRRAAVTWTCDIEELETTRQLTRWIADDLARLGVAQLRGLPAMHDDGAWRASVRDGFHPAGTTRMARDPEAGVVDPHLQVHGVGGLFVVGGSVFPTSGYANPTLTIVALADRLAAHLSALGLREVVSARGTETRYEPPEGNLGNLQGVG